MALRSTATPTDSMGHHYAERSGRSFRSSLLSHSSHIKGLSAVTFVSAVL